jgi:glucan biosynthesis protein C
METKIVQRRYDIDWLRVLAFSAVFIYHCSRFFDSSYWHVKNSQTSALVDTLKGIFDLWGMPLLFLISGASIYLALRPGGSVRFIRDRVWRLLVPLAFGILVLGPPQIYLERLSHGEFNGSFLEFLPIYFNDWHTWGGNFAWSGVHLWYLEYLFLFTLFLLPLFALLKQPSSRCMLESLARLSARPGVIFLWAVPFALLGILFDPLGILRPAPSEDLVRLIVFPPFLVFGFLVFSNDLIQQAIIRQRRVALFLAITITLAVPVISDFVSSHSNFLVFVLVMVFVGILIWSSILTVLGYGMRYLARNSRWLGYANEGVLPIYILHQPVILVIGFFIIPLALPILAKYLIILTLAFGVTLGLYEFGIRRLNPVRRIFGLKVRKPDTQAGIFATEPSS